MRDTMTIRLGQRGVLTLPKALRELYRLRPGDILTLQDLGGIFVLSPTRSEIDTQADQILSSLIQRGETLESMLAVLREEREKCEGRATRSSGIDRS